jgi:hypothetical protein
MALLPIAIDSKILNRVREIVASKNLSLRVDDNCYDGCIDVLCDKCNRHFSWDVIDDVIALAEALDSCPMCNSLQKRTLPFKEFAYKDSAEAFCAGLDVANIQHSEPKFDSATNLWYTEYTVA